MAFLFQQLGGRLPSIGAWTARVFRTAVFTASSYTLTSKSLTGLSKSAAVSFGLYGTVSPSRSVRQGDAFYSYGAHGPVRSAWPPFVARGRQAQHQSAAFQASAFTLTSKSLTGLSKSAAVSFGAYGAVRFTRVFRMPGDEGRFSSAGATAVAFTATVTANLFRSDGGTLILFDGEGVQTVFQSNGATAITFVGNNGQHQFRSNGSTAISFRGGVSYRFRSDGALVLVWYGSAGQLPSCITGSGVVPPGLGGGNVKNAVH